MTQTEELERTYRVNQIAEATMLLIEASTITNQAEAAEGIALALRKSHRTVQQNFFRTLVAALPAYLEDGFDLRNEACASLCQKVLDLDIHMPYV
jgi:hypothetical protein